MRQAVSCSSADLLFQPRHLFVIVIADGAAALTQHRADLFEGVPKDQQVENQARALIHTPTQLPYQDILIQLSRDVMAILRDLARALRQNSRALSLLIQFGQNQALVGLEEISLEIGNW